MEISTISHRWSDKLTHSSIYKSSFLFVSGLSAAFKIYLGGELYGTDILLCCAAVFLICSGGTKILDRNTLWLFLAWIMWFLGLMVADITNGTEAQALTRGWARVLFFGSDVLGIVLLVGWDTHRLRSLLLGWAMSYFVQGFFLPGNVIVAENPGKFAFSCGCCLLLSLSASSKLARRLGTSGQVMPILVAAVIGLLLNLRSLFGVLCLSALFSWLNLYVVHRNPGLRRNLSPAFFIGLIVLGLGASLFVERVYAGLAGSGSLGFEAKEKYEEQSRGDLGIFVGGRPEILISARAIAASPIVGRGSWARDAALVEQYVELLRAAGYGGVIEEASSDLEWNLIPSHSYIFGSWVEAGIFGAVFWIYIMFLSFSALYNVLKVEFAWAAMIIPIVFVLMWDILFTPFAGDHRFTAACGVYVAVWTVYKCRQISSNEQNAYRMASQNKWVSS
jgi:hypothetical protein